MVAILASLAGLAQLEGGGVGAADVPRVAILASLAGLAQLEGGGVGAADVPRVAILASLAGLAQQVSASTQTWLSNQLRSSPASQGWRSPSPSRSR